MNINTLSRLKLRPVAGVDYSSPSPTRTYPMVFHSRKVYAGPVLGMGNSKISKDVGIFDMLSVVTCPNCKECARKCYARKAEKQYPATWNKRVLNTAQAVETPALLIERSIWQIRMHRIRVVRIHSAGDFFSQAYADLWGDIARALPEVRFYGYTKSPYRPRAGNLNLVESILPGGELNFGSIEVVQGLSRAYHAPVCPAAWERGRVICGETCSLCLTHKYVVFKEH